MFNKSATNVQQNCNNCPTKVQQMFNKVQQKFNKSATNVQ